MMLIWWLTSVDAAAIGEIRAAWPTWMSEQFQSLRGRAGRGRLWVADRFANLDVNLPEGLPAWGSPLGKIAQMSGGILITTNELRFLTDLPGLVTDLHLQRHY